jgi:hypothetical protein
MGPGNLHKPENCPECGKVYILYTHRFRPPKQNDINAWKVVSFLYEHGFEYQHIRDKEDRRDVGYPQSLIDAKDFVIEYKDQAIKTSVPPSGG